MRYFYIYECVFVKNLLLFISRALEMKLNYRYFLVLIPITLIVIGQSLAKIGASYIQLNNFSISQVLNIFIIVAFICLMLRGLVWLVLLRMFNLAFVYPSMSVSYILMLIVSYLVFNEVITVANIAGSCLIALGVFCTSLAEKDNKSKGFI